MDIDWLSSKCWEYVNKYNLKDWTKESCKRFIYNNQQLVIDFFNAMDCIEVLYIGMFGNVTFIISVVTDTVNSIKL